MAKSEADDLNLHVALCAERYEGIQAEFGRLTARMDKIEIKVDNIHNDIISGQKSLKSVLITTAGTVVAGLISLVMVILMKF